MKMTEDLTDKIDNISTLSSYLEAVKEVCVLYQEQHPIFTPYLKKEFPFFTGADSHRSQANVEKILEYADKVKGFNTIEQFVEILISINDSLPRWGGTLSDSLLLCRDTWLSNNSELRTAYKEQIKQNENDFDNIMRPF